jgi:hypothetical protein
MGQIKTSLALLCLGLAAGSLPVHAQVDFAGHWVPLFHEDAPERGPGPELGDYMGIPINEAARLRADSYDGDRISVVTEYQCRPHGGDYSMRGLSNMRIDQILDPVTQQLIGIHTRMGFQEMERTIWLDGRPHPSELAAHTFSGFTTGVWQDNMLIANTTHQKESYLRRNGLPRSFKATFTEYWVRHGNYLTVTTAIFDPAFLTEPLVRSQSWVNDPGQQMGTDTCEYGPEVPAEPGVVPNHLPGTNPFLHEIADWYGMPYEATRGGAETMYPEYMKKMGKPEKPAPAKCERYCDCQNQGRGCNVTPPRR